MLAPETRVFVVTGGWSAEREVSLASGREVDACLRGAGQPVRLHDLNPAVPRADAVRALLDEVKAFGPDVVFIAMHGPFGEDGTLQGLLELAGLPYNGSGVLATALANDKVVAKQVFVANRITTPRSAVIPRGTTPPSPPLPLPIVLKPRALGSSVGVSLVERGEDFGPAFARAAAEGQDVLVESYVRGRELTAGVIDGEPLPVIEVVVPPGRIYDYQAKYTPGGAVHKTPAPLPKKQYEAAQRTAVATYRALGCEGAARVDMIAEDTGTLYVIELQTLPGLTVTSLLPESARAAGLSFLDLIRGELVGALRRRPARVAPAPVEAAR